MRRKLLVGNWKMNKNRSEALDFIQHFLNHNKIQQPGDLEVFIAPAYPLLESTYRATEHTALEVAAQDVSAHESGAYTGEVSADMLYSIGVKTVIIGHSERRRHFGERGPTLTQKIQRALRARMEVIYCVGEDAEARRKRRQFEAIEGQLDVLDDLDADDMGCISIAYEPVWAIGSGQSATPIQAQAMHRYIRDSITDRFSAELASFTSILYGGSLTPENATEIFAQPDVDGGLVGKAALNADRFIGLIKALSS